VTSDEAGVPGGAPEAGDGAGSGGAGGAGGQRDLLAEVAVLRRRARSVRHADWFPLVVVGVLTCASIPFYQQPGPPAGGPANGFIVGTQPGLSLPFLGGSGLVRGYLGYYWAAALAGGLVLTLLWYRWHARRVGLQTPSGGYLVTMVVLAGLAIGIPLLSQVHSPHSLRFLGHLRALWPGDLVMRGTFPFVIIAVGLLVLAWAERSRALTVTAAIYAGVSVVASLYDISNLTARLGWILAPPQQSLPNVLLPGLILLITGTAAFAVQRRRQALA
jgi:hypothetical protein